MGGEDTEVSGSTTAIVLEAAHFQPVSVSRTFRRHGLPSEASKRFERGVDPQVPYAAARRAAELLTTHGGGAMTAETVVGSAPTPHRVSLRSGLIPAVLGTRVDQDESVRLLAASGVSVTSLGDSLTLEVPSWRGDLVDPYDIVEEVGRHIGYDRIGLKLPIPPVSRGLAPRLLHRRAVLRAIAALGFTEVLSPALRLRRGARSAADPGRRPDPAAHPAGQPAVRDPSLPADLLAAGAVRRRGAQHLPQPHGPRAVRAGQGVLRGWRARRTASRCGAPTVRRGDRRHRRGHPGAAAHGGRRRHRQLEARGMGRPGCRGGLDTRRGPRGARRRGRGCAAVAAQRGAGAMASRSLR